MSTWLITGANRGLGFEFCRQLHDRGENVIASCRDVVAASELRSMTARLESLDVSDSNSVRVLAEKLRGVAIDVLVNNAGIGGGSGSGLSGMDAARLRPYFEVNTLGALRVTSALLPNLRKGKQKKVVNITSKMGSLADNTSGGFYGYRASKAALNMVTRNMAHDLARDGFKVVAVHPGWVRTDMGGAGARITPEESVRAMLELISGLTEEHNGAFLDAENNGETIPW